MSSRLLLPGALLALAACTDVDLLKPRTSEVQKGIATVEGRFCTDDPDTIVFPVKLWFIIDDSGSMQTNDPNQKRYEEPKALAQRLEKPGVFFFGGETFAGDANGARRFTQPERFTDSATTFGENVDAVKNPGNGGTPYLAALNFAFGELSDDVRKNPVVARRSRYVIIFLSDGAPTDSQSPQILDAVRTIMSLKQDVGAITLNTVFLGGPTGPTQSLLETMATEGGGLFKSFPNGDALSLDGFDLSGLRRTYQQRFFLVANRTVLATGDGPRADSDMDGLSDEREAQLGSDPTKRDSDEDGCGDAMEARVGWNPNVPGQLNGECVCGANERNDTDRDGLTDCEERWLGTSKVSPDSDLAPDRSTVGDWLYDLVDSDLLADPGGPNETTDKDIDGVSDVHELRTHTAPTFADVALHERFAYRYTRFVPDRTEPRCTDFTVENVFVGDTLATDGHAARENVIEVYFGQSPEDEPWKERTFHLARKTVVDDGTTLRVEFSPADFTTVLQDVAESTVAAGR
ncbi:MAG: VWA domain-containing protein [Myxococcota bacterium]|jgi:hypothetical protein